MSVQFGRWNLDGQPSGPEYVDKVNATLAPYGPDSNESYSAGGLTILYRAFHSTKESCRESQPHVSRCGAVVTWDGRLDNRVELITQLRGKLTRTSTDVEIVAAAFEHWGNHCLGKLIGDWAVSIWDPQAHSVLLAKDPIGTRHLYYAIAKDHIVWSTTLNPIVFFEERRFQLCEEYVAGWFSSYPATNLTAYVGVHAVPPSSSVLLQPGRHTVSSHWDFDPGKMIRYRSDPEYEEHFRTLFSAAVQRRLRSHVPVLSELSGGRDSSCIVCVADTVISRGQAECPRLDTISYYDDSEPNWNERPYFTKVEEKRGRTGWHVGAQDPTQDAAPDPFASFVPAPNYPGYDGRTSPHMRACLASQGNRVVLSGIGGDEVMGGVPSSAAELQDLLARGRFRTLAHQLKVWALEKRKPWFHLFWEAARDFLPLWLVGVPKNAQCAPWLQPRFVKRHGPPLRSYAARTKLFGPLPTFQANVATLDAVRRQLVQVAPSFGPPFEKRYPYLDRDLLEFLFAIPREQLVRPTQRRSLMRRALAGIVPDEILNRKNKAFVARAPLVHVSNEWAELSQMTQHLVSSSLGFVDSALFMETLQKARRGDDDVPVSTLLHTLFVEGWLNTLHARGFIGTGTNRKSELALQASTQA